MHKTHLYDPGFEEISCGLKHTRYRLVTTDKSKVTCCDCNPDLKPKEIKREKRKKPNEPA